MKFSHLDTIQLKAELNKSLTELGLTSGKIHTVVNTQNGGTVLEADLDGAATWLSNSANQRSLCEKIGSNAEFRTQNYSIIALNVPIAINLEQDSHHLEICEANDLEPNTITPAKWAKAVGRRTPDQRTAHLILTLNDTNAANRAITNGLSICNRKCQVERS